MKAASPLLSAGFMMVCLLGAAPLSTDERSHCPCPVIPPWPGTRTPPEDCRQINSTFRYSCLEGTLRKAGTSNRIKCEQKDGNVEWEESKLECIDDPRRPKPQTTTTISTGQTSSTSLHVNQSTVAHDGKGGDNMDEKLHNAVTPTAVKTWTVETSTFSLGVANNRTSEALSARSQTAIISCASLVVVCALMGIVCVLYRRRSRNNTWTEPAEEELPMRPPDGLSFSRLKTEQTI